MSRRPHLAAIAALSLLLSGLVVLLTGTPASYASVACGSGAYNIYVATPGACVWGTMDEGHPSIPGDQTRLTVQVKDTKADGVCATLQVWNKITLGKDQKGTLKTVCGKGKVSWFVNTFPTIFGSRYIRVCAKSCSEWVHIHN